MLILITCSRWCLVFSTILVIMFCLVTSKQCVRKTLLRLCLSSKFPLWVSIYWWFLPGSMSGKIPTPSMFTSWHLAFYCNRVSFLILESQCSLWTHIVLLLPSLKWLGISKLNCTHQFPSKVMATGENMPFWPTITSSEPHSHCLPGPWFWASPEEELGVGLGLQEHRVPGGRFKAQLQHFLSTPPLEVRGTWCPSSRPLLHNPSHAARLKVPLARALSLTGHPKQPGTWGPQDSGCGSQETGIGIRGPHPDEQGTSNPHLAALWWLHGTMWAWAMPGTQATGQSQYPHHFPHPHWLLQLDLCCRDRQLPIGPSFSFHSAALSLGSSSQGHFQPPLQGNVTPSTVPHCQWDVRRDRCISRLSSRSWMQGGASGLVE